MANARTLDPNAKLSFIERFAYGLGDYSANLVYTSISSFLLVYYISVLKADAGAAASVIAISKLFDGFSDLIMGRIVDKTHSKWGKARPWILRMCVPLAVCTVIMFSVPASLTGGVQFAYMFLTYNLVSTVFYTALNLPYATLQGLMTTNQYERGLLGNFRMLMASFGVMTVNTVVLKMCEFFGGGDQYNQRGWTVTYIILMIVFVILNLITFTVCKERVVDENASSENGEKPQGPSLITCLKSLIVNKYWLLIVLQLFTIYFMMATFYGSNLYYADYVLGNSDAFATISNAMTIAQIVIMFITPFMMKKIGKRWTSTVGLIAAFLGFVATYFAGTNFTMVVACNALKGIGLGCSSAVVFGMLQDTITYGQWLTGVQAMGMGNAASSFCIKIGSGLGTAVLGQVLGMAGFNDDPTSAASIAAIKVSCIWIPVIACAIGIICMLVYDLDKHYGQAAKDLSEGKWKGSHT